MACAAIIATCLLSSLTPFLLLAMTLSLVVAPDATCCDGHHLRGDPTARQTCSKVQETARKWRTAVGLTTPPLWRSNIVFYVALGALGAVGLLALLATGRVSPQNVLGLLIALSNAFGLIAGEQQEPGSGSG